MSINVYLLTDTSPWGKKKIPTYGKDYRILEGQREEHYLESVNLHFPPCKAVMESSLLTFVYLPADELKCSINDLECNY